MAGKRNMKRWSLCVLSVWLVLLLGGCLYPDDQLKQNQVPYKDQIAAVQTAVNQFQTDSGGLLPIKTRDMSTPLYQKYPIDFNKLMPSYMQEPPGTAFESGGVYSYVLINVEKAPTVKVIDVRMADKIRDLTLRLDMYRESNSGYVPFGKVLGKGVFALNYKKLGLDQEPYVESPFTGHNLPLIVNQDGKLFVDYSSDLYAEMKETKEKLQAGQDIRSILMEHSDFVPAYSLPYTIDSKKDEPVFLEK